MAPFKLKFRMGSSRSTSQEHDTDPQVNEALLNHHHSTAIGASSSTIDSADCNSLGSMGTNERKSLLPCKANNDLRLGIHNHSVTTCMGESAEGLPTSLPTTPPPSYEHVLEENTRLANKFDLSQQCQFHVTDDCTPQSRRSSISNSGNSIHLSSLEHLTLSTAQCTDPHCQENYGRSNDSLQRQHELLNERHNLGDYNGRVVSNNNDNNETDYDDGDIDNRKESIDSTELLISTRMSAPSSQENQNLLEGCTSSCPQFSEQCGEQCDENCSGNKGANNDFFDPLINHSGYCSNDMRFNDDCQEHSQNQVAAEYEEGRCDSDSDGGWDSNKMSNSHSQQQHYNQQQQERALTPEIISNKSSKEIYKDLAKQWGITCKMSDACRCMECQSHYFDCEFDENEHQKTDGGLGAGTPMFISEVMHGSACNIL